MKHGKRVSVNFPEDIMSQLEDLSALTSESLSSIVVDKVREALELDEDAYWAKIIKERQSEEGSGTYISLEEAWKNIQSK